MKHMDGHIGEAVAKRAEAVWFPPGAWSRDAEDEARRHGLMVVKDRCIVEEHRHLFDTQGQPRRTSTNDGGGRPIRKGMRECRMAAIGRCVLVPTDFSETSHAALACAVSLVERCDASLHLLHVVEAIVGAEPLGRHPDVLSEVERAVERSVLEELRDLLSADDHARLRVRLAVEWGTATVEILRYARSHDVDLIAMGRHGRSGIKHMLLGSVADKVVCHAPCAVLSVGY
jgi:nucleotide-binding universal stress UspA family protein